MSIPKCLGKSSSSHNSAQTPAAGSPPLPPDSITYHPLTHSVLYMVASLLFLAWNVSVSGTLYLCLLCLKDLSHRFWYGCSLVFWCVLICHLLRRTFLPILLIIVFFSAHFISLACLFFFSMRIITV